MAASLFKKDGDGVDSAELSNSDDSTSMEEFRHMITRPDWLQIFKKNCEEEKLAELQNKRSIEKPAVECISVPDAESISSPTRQRSRRCKSTTVSNVKPAVKDISVPDAECISMPVTRRSRRCKGTTVSAEPAPVFQRGTKKRQQQKASQKAAESTCLSPQRGQKKRQGASRQAVRGRRGGRNRGHVQSNTSENSDPDIVFLSENDTEIRTVQTSEVCGMINATPAASLNDSIEVISVSSHKDSDIEEIDQDTEVTIFFCWRNKFLKLPMKQTTQFGTVLSTLSSSWDVQGSVIMLLHNDKIVKAEDTPSTYEMLTGSIIDCSVVKSKALVDVTDPNVITIKLQTKDSRDKKPMAVHKMTQFQSIIEQFAKEEGIPVNKVVFKFDGDTIAPTDTPFSLDIQDNYSIDVAY